jgi:hypothetical protein
VLARYADFFRLFGDFRGYIEFFLLQDLVTEDYCAVGFSAPFSDFNTPAVPKIGMPTWRIRSLRLSS